MRKTEKKNKPPAAKKIIKTDKVAVAKPTASKPPVKATATARAAKATKPGKAGKAGKAVKPAKADPEKKFRVFMLMDVDNCDIGRYTGHAPRQAALKAANAGVIDIRLRETGVRRKVGKKGVIEIKVHMFRGSRGQRPKKDSDPDWMPAVVNFPMVEKVGTEWIPRSN